jgi:hypothetical protein
MLSQLLVVADVRVLMARQPGVDAAMRLGDGAFTRMAAADPVTLGGGALILLLIIVAAGWFIRRRVVTEAERRDLPIVLFAPGPGRAAAAPRRAAPDAAGERDSPPARPPLRIVEDRDGPRARSDDANGANSASEYDGTLQLLPGRLEPVQGGLDQEIRFVKRPGVNRFTFGRSPGPRHVHIQLSAPTASRMHAFMVFENGRWRVGNMSSTNRVIVNGAPLESDDEARLLEDGDCIELGEIAFIFRER